VGVSLDRAEDNPEREGDAHRVGTIRTVDYHAGGQPIRIVVEGGPALRGATASERRASAEADPALDAFREFLCWEPRGHADMYAAYIFPSGDPHCNFGAVFCHNTGYPPSCGHGTLALAAYAVESGLVHSDPDGETMVRIEVPAGRAAVQVRQRGGVITALRVERDLSYPIALDQHLQTRVGTVRYDLAFSGATFACVDVQSLGLAVDAAHSGRLVSIAQDLLQALNADAAAGNNPLDERLNGVFGVVFYEDHGAERGHLRQCAVNIFNDGWIERSPGGAMTGARLALLLQRGELAEGAPLIQESISGASAFAWANPVHSTEHPLAVRTTLESSAYRTGEHRFVADARDGVRFSFR
jgi:proline racemase